MPYGAALRFHFVSLIKRVSNWHEAGNDHFSLLLPQRHILHSLLFDPRRARDRQAPVYKVPALRRWKGMRGA